MVSAAASIFFIVTIVCYFSYLLTEFKVSDKFAASQSWVTFEPNVFLFSLFLIEKYYVLVIFLNRIEQCVQGPSDTLVSVALRV